MQFDLKSCPPEQVGVSSENVIKFLDYVKEYKINLHSFMMIKDGKVFAEGYYPFFNKDFLHRQYSSSKTLVSLAVGYLITKGKLNLDDKLVDLCPDFFDNCDKECNNITIRHCLTMTNPINVTDCERPSGMVFTYYSGADLLAKLIKRITGMEFYQVLRPVFDEIGVSNKVWCVEDLDDHAWGGSGMLCTLSDFAKVGLLLLNKGACNGVQLIDKEYMEKVCSVQKSNQLDNSYFHLYNGGYGFLTWITPHATCMRGMGCQQAFCFHDKNLLFVCHGDTQSTTDKADAIVYELFRNLIYNNISTPTETNNAYNQLQDRLSNLTLPHFGKPHSDYQKILNGKKYLLKQNTLGWEWVKFNFSDNLLKITYKNARGEKTIKAGLGDYYKSTFPETHYYDVKRGKPSGREHDCIAIAEWIEEKQLLLRCYVIDTSMGNFVMNLSFNEDKIAILSNKRAEFFFEDYEGFAGGKLC